MSEPTDTAARLRAEVIQWMTAEREKVVNVVKSRHESAAAWRHGTDADHESARKMAQRQSGRLIDKTTAGEREQFAVREDRIAKKKGNEIRLFDAALDMLASAAAEREPHDVVLRLAKEATNGWACYAKRKIEHEEIARLHREIAAATAREPVALPPAAPASAPDAPTAEPERLLEMAFHAQHTGSFNMTAEGRAATTADVWERLSKELDDPPVPMTPHPEAEAFYTVSERTRNEVKRALAGRAAPASGGKVVKGICPTCGNQTCVKCGGDHRYGANHLYEAPEESE